MRNHIITTVILVIINLMIILPVGYTTELGKAMGMVNLMAYFVIAEMMDKLFPES